MKANGQQEIKLNIGSGKQALDGYVSIDAHFGNIAFPLAYGDETVAECRASHILEHFPQGQTLDVLKDWARVLKPGGWLKIAVPDFTWIAKEYVEGNADGLPIFSYLMGSQLDENDFHKAVFNEATLKYLLDKAGLTDIQPWKSEINDCAALPVSLNLMGRKPDVLVEPSNGKHFVAGEWREESTLIKDSAKVRCGIVMSTPRHGSLDSAECIFEIAAGIGAPRFKTTGAWRYQGRGRSVDTALDFGSEGKREWEEELTEALDKAVESGMDLIVTADYDTFATPNEAKELIKLLYQNPQYDCIVPLQIRRGTFQEILATFADKPDMNQALVPILTGHFGLTVFRRRVFERLTRPWFLPIPDEEGKWGPGRTDADIYFWNKFAQEGFKAALATQVVIGHGDEVVTWPKFENGKIVKVYQPLYAWHATRKAPQ